MTVPVLVAHAETTANATSVVGTASASWAIGDYLLVHCSGGGAAATFTVTDSVGNTYTAITPQGSAASGTACTDQFFECTSASAAGTSGSTTITVAKASGGIGFAAYKFPAGSTKDDSESGSNVSAVATATTSAIDVDAGSTTMVGATSAAARTFTAGASFTYLAGYAMSGGTNPRAFGTAYFENTSSSTATQVPTLNIVGGNNAFAASAVVINDPPSGVSGNLTLSGTGTLSFAGTPAAPGTLTLAGTGTLSLTRVSGPKAVMLGPGDSTQWRSGTTASPPSREATTRTLFEGGGFKSEDTGWEAAGGKDMHSADSNGRTAIQSIQLLRSTYGVGFKIHVPGLGINDFGDSDANFIAEVQAIMTEYGSTDRVLWINMSMFSAVNSNALHFNPILASTLSAYGNVTVLDWADYSHNVAYDVNDWNGSGDAAHMTVQGWAKRDAYILAAVQAAVPGILTLGGNGVLVFGAVPRMTGTLVLAGTGTLTLVAAPALAAALGLSGTGALTFARQPAMTSALPLSGTGTLSLTGQPAMAAALTLGGTGTLTLSGSTGTVGNLTLGGTGTLTLGSTPTMSGALGLSGTGTLALVGKPATAASLAFSGTGTLSLAAAPAMAAPLTLGGVGTLTLTGSASGNTGTLTLSGIGTLALASIANTQAALTLGGTGTLTLGGSGGQVDVIVTSIAGKSRQITFAQRSRQTTIHERHP